MADRDTCPDGITWVAFSLAEALGLVADQIDEQSAKQWGRPCVSGAQLEMMTVWAAHGVTSQEEAAADMERRTCDRSARRQWMRDSWPTVGLLADALDLSDPDRQGRGWSASEVRSAAEEARRG